MAELRIHPLLKRELVQQGLHYAVIIDKDVSVRSPGAVEGVFCRQIDAEWFRDRLNTLYEGGGWGPESHRVVPLNEG